MDVNTNGYTIGFALAMGTLVAVVLALLSTGLQPSQDINKDFAQKKNLLTAVGYGVDTLEASFIEEVYEKNFDGFTVNVEGSKVGETKADAFAVDMAKEVKKEASERILPVFVYTDNSGEKQYILQARGSGLWDAIWVYCSVKNDRNTISGAVFGHKAETPGLGAKIKDDVAFYGDFAGKKLFAEDGTFAGITVLKGEGEGVKAKCNDNQVDGISGATMTCNGVSAMMQNALGEYKKFLKK